MKKLISLVLTLTLLFSFSLSSLAACDVDSKTITFNEDGKLRIMVISDFQSSRNPSSKSVAFLNTLLDTYSPDLVIICGDQISGSSNMMCKAKEALYYQLSPINDRKIPFLYTFGNHDCETGLLVSKKNQASIYNSYEYCFADENGCDYGTYNKVIYGSDGVTPIFNVYMMDTHNSSGLYYDTVHEDQVEWYKNKSAELKELNGGNPLPSMLFQHIPVKEIYSVLKEVSRSTPGAVSYNYSLTDNNYTYYVLDESKLLEGHTCYMGLGESPCSEGLKVTSGEYEAWLERGDITLGAYFGHDHDNDFISVDDNGIQLGYVGGFGFDTYGDGDNRCVKIIDLDENDVENYKVQTVRYCDLMTSTDTSYKTDMMKKYFSFTVSSFFKKFFSK